MVQDLEGEVAERLLGALDPLARVRLCKRNAQELASGLQLAVLASFGNIYFSGLGEGVKVFDTLFEVRVVNARLKPESVLDGTRECIEKI